MVQTNPIRGVLEGGSLHFNLGKREEGMLSNHVVYVGLCIHEHKHTI